LKGQKTPVLKMPKWALFRVSDPIITPMGSEHFAGFSKIARIGKPGHKRGFGGDGPNVEQYPVYALSRICFGISEGLRAGREVKNQIVIFDNAKEHCSEKNNQENLFHQKDKSSTGFSYIFSLLFFIYENPNFPGFSGFFFEVTNLRLSIFSRFLFALPSPAAIIFCRFFLARIWPFTRFTFVCFIVGNSAILWGILFLTNKII
jgi:hypothetical protein